MTARELGFDSISANSLDAVSDRDFAIELAFCLSMVMMHLSRLSEELIFWVSSAFSFVELPDAFCTGSSIMPQKKNPDVPELVRGKTGRVYGHLMGLLTMMKGLPLAYNRDLQEDKEALFDSIDTVKACLSVTACLVSGMKPREEVLRREAETGFMTATDLADYLVGKGVPFRTAHEIVGRAVSKCLSKGKELTQLNLEELKDLHPGIGADVFEILSARGSIDSRNCPGGTGTHAVEEQLRQARKWLQGSRIERVV
jgi:argininosuccinate lyase